jgi:two-component system, chemotaxis family, protein-glutamate methylesterase/glutaminase
VIRVAVVDDSPFIRKALAWMLADEPGIELVGTARRGEELLENLTRWRADLIVLDLAMPGLGGLKTLAEIRHRRPTPVIIFSDSLGKSGPQTLEALHSGAVDFIDKRDFSLVDFEALRKALVGRIRQLARSRRAHHWERQRRREPAPVPLVAATGVPPQEGGPALMLIGASTGGPHAIERVLCDLGPPLGCPLVVAQHMPAGFTRAFASRLDGRLPWKAQEIVHGERLLPGTVYVVPGGFHAAIEKGRPGLMASLTSTADPNQPSVDVLFGSAAAVVASRALAVLLTGMGDDGARGMVELARAGSYTIAQDETTSVVFGMPRAAIEAGGARETLPLSSIGGRLRQLAAAGPPCDALALEREPCSPEKS